MEQLGVSYKKVDGILYPQVNCDKESIVLFGRGGKYGYLWISYMKENYPDRYKTLERFSRISETAIRTNDEAYELLDATVEAYLKNHKPENPESTIECWKLNDQAITMAEEIVYSEVVYHWR